VQHQPTISLCLICGDEGVQGIERLLNSCLERPAGPMFDEVSIYWNGSGEKKPEFMGRETWETKSGEAVAMVVSEGPWKNDFAWARNISYQQANGVWRCYLDTDDIIPLHEEKAVADAVEAAGGKVDENTPIQTLKEFLTELPQQINCIWSPYNYVEIYDKVALRIPRRRIVRWEDGWAWHSRVHEDLMTIRGNVEHPAVLTGFVVQHRPYITDGDRGKRNADILREQLEESMNKNIAVDARTFYGLATVKFDGGEYVEAVELLRNALAAQHSDQDHLLFNLLLSETLFRMQRVEEAKRAAIECVVVYPDDPHGYLQLGRVAYLQGDFPKAVRWFEKGFANTTDFMATHQDPMMEKGMFRAIGASALCATGAYDKAVEWANMAVEADPGTFQEVVLGACQKAQKKASLANAYSELATHLIKQGDRHAAKALAAAVPTCLEHHGAIRPIIQNLEGPPVPVNEAGELSAEDGQRIAPDARPTVVSDRLCTSEDIDKEIEQLVLDGKGFTAIVPDGDDADARVPKGAKRAFSRERLLKTLSRHGDVVGLQASRLPHEEDPKELGMHIVAHVEPARATAGRVAIWCPAFAAPWGPFDPETTGTGGSEEAAVYLSEALWRKGYSVDVYAPIGAEEQPLTVKDGVVWRDLEQFSPHLKYDHLIMHRTPWGPNIHNFQSENVWVWHHDHYYEPSAWNPVSASACKHLFVSRWQRKILENQLGIPVSGWTIYNGIPVRQFAEIEAVERDPHAIAYASMPNRGLPRLLRIWDEIKAAVPEATLNIYYGLNTYRQLWRGTQMFDHEDHLTVLDVYNNPKWQEKGVFPKGRIGQKALTAEFFKSGVLAYPSNFPEVHMIAQVRAAAAGMKIVTTPTGCLEETLADKTYLVPDALSDEQWDSGGKDRFIEHLVRALTEDETEYDRAGVAASTLERYSWDRVAERVVEAFDAAERGDDETLSSDVFEDTPPPEEKFTIQLPADPVPLKSLSM